MTLKDPNCSQSTHPTTAPVVILTQPDSDDGDTTDDDDWHLEGLQALREATRKHARLGFAAQDARAALFEQRVSVHAQDSSTTASSRSTEGSGVNAAPSRTAAHRAASLTTSRTSEPTESRSTSYKQRVRARARAGDASAVVQARRMKESENARRQKLRQKARDGDEDALAWVQRQAEIRARARK